MQEIPRIYSLALIKALSKREFEGNVALLALCEAQIFFTELYKLFCKLNTAGLNSSRLFEILNNTAINSTDKERLRAVFSVYKKFRETIEDSNYELPLCKAKNVIIPNDFNQWAKELASGGTIEFDDIQNEIIYIAQEIKKQVESGAEYSDFGIFLTNEAHKRTYAQLFSALDVPTNYKNLNEETSKFRIKLEQLLNYCETCDPLILENLNFKESDIIEIKALYNIGCYTKIISKISSFDAVEINKRVGAIVSFYENIIKERPENSTILNVVDNYLNSTKDDENCVEIFSHPKRTYKNLYIPSLIESTLTGKEYIYFVSPKSNNEISSAIRKISPKFEKIIQDENKMIDFEIFENVVKKCESKLVLSTFNYSESKQIQPSVLFELFKNHTSFKSHKDGSIGVIEINTEENKRNEIETIISKNETLHLSASAIANFQKCPKKYFFKNLLKLKEQNDFSASYGSIVHAIIEVFNTNHSSNYTKVKILQLCDTLFLSKISPQTALENGFKEIDVELITSTDDLALAQMRDNFYSAVEQLEENNFFNQPNEIHCEKEFEFQIDNVVYDGRIDCIKKEAGSFVVVDYKTGKDKKKPLEYYTNQDGLKLEEDYEFQIPLYFLGTKYSKELQKFNVSSFALEYIRPDDYNKDVVDSALLNNVQEKIVQKLKEEIVEKIFNSKEFEPKPEKRKCDYCSYLFLCDETEDVEEC